jgi:hypothetical protein
VDAFWETTAPKPSFVPDEPFPSSVVVAPAKAGKAAMVAASTNTTTSDTATLMRLKG